MRTKFELKTTCSNTMINYLLIQNFKLSENCEFNHLIILTISKPIKSLNVFSLELK